MKFPGQRLSPVSVPVKHLRLGMSMFVDETVMSEILFSMSCMKCYVELKQSCLIFKKSCFLSELKCGCLLVPSSFTSSHPMR